MQSITLRRRTAVATALVLATALAPLLAVAGPAAAQGVGAPTVTGDQVRGEAADYATQTFADPWDYANREDLQTDPGPVMNHRSIAVADGRLSVTFEGTGHFHQIWGGWPGGLRLDRDGPANPVDATRYRQVSFRIHSTLHTVGAISFQTCPDVDAGCTGSVPFVLAGTGWETVTVDMTQGTGNPWSGPIHALAVTIGSAGEASYQLDWMRLHEPVQAATITYTNTDLFGEAVLHWDADADPSNNTGSNPGWGVVAASNGVTGGAAFDVGAYPPGEYRFYVTSGSSRSAYSTPLVIEGAPRVRIDNPDITGGEDYATAVLGNPWDFSGPDDVAELLNLTGVSYENGRMYATNAGPDIGNPFLVMPDTGDLQAGRYHRFTIRTGFEGPFSLSHNAGGGMHGRISWKQDGQFELHQSAEVVTYTDRDTYTVVMGDPTPPVPLMEPDLGPQPGWNTGRTTQGLRWDANEDIGARRWWVDDIRLAADDESFGQFGIEWHDTRHQPGTTVELFADTDRRGFDGVRVASGLAQVDGRNTFTWDTTALPQGEYWVHATATSPNGVATTRTYATGPVQVRTPAAGFVQEPPGLRSAGASRIETAIELAQEAFPGGAETALVARANDFPDALAAAPLAAAVDGPVLLNDDTSLHAGVRAELQRLGVRRVIILGGTAAQSAAVETELRSLVDVVERAAGLDRFATARQVAERAVAEWSANGQTVGPPLVALGSQFTDALAAASLAGHEHRPLLLTNHDVVPPATQQALRDLQARSVTVIGGAGIITGGVLDRLGQITGRVERLAGADHYETAALVADAAIAAGASPGVVVVASGDAFPDALAAGAAAIARGGVLLLTPRDSAALVTRTFLGRAPVAYMRIAGGTAAVSSPVAAALADAAGM